MKKILFSLFILFISNLAIAKSNDLILSAEGLGTIKIGMTQEQVESVLGKKLTSGTGMIPDSELKAGKCSYVTIPNQDGVALLLKNGKVVRLEIINPKITTDKFIKINSSEKQVKSAYKKQISPVEGNFLLYTTNSKNGIIFEIDNDKVLTMSSGQISVLKRGCEGKS